MMEVEKTEQEEKLEMVSEDFRKAVKNFYSNYHKDQKVPQLIRNRRYKKLQEVQIIKKLFSSIFFDS
jgi:hypothetical protein